MKATALLPHHQPTRLLLELDLSRGLAEAPPSTPLEALRARHVPVLRALVDALRTAAQDEHVAGIVAHIGGAPPSLAQSAELRAAVRDFVRSGKPAVAWSESYGEMGPGNVGYHLASAFGQVWVQPSGDVGLTGVVAQAVFVRDALDRLGVQPQIAKRAEYKTAPDMLLRKGMSEAHREMAGRLAASAMETIVADVAASRGLAPAAVREAVDQAPLGAEEALRRGLVDRIGYRDEVYHDLHRRFGPWTLRYLERYARAVERRTAVTTVGARVVPGQRRPVVAVVQASGPIHLGRAGGSPMSGPSVGSDSLGATLRAAARDHDVKAVVLRVDSPGGSYVASDAIRREVLALRHTGRPVIASMATVAGSGGYYIAMPCDEVVAGAGTLTGSIGVFAGKQVLRDALAKIGVAHESVAVGAHAEMFSSGRPFTDEEWQRLEAWLDRVYADFTAKAAQDRRMPVEQLREVARGRVWTGADARGHGLVDHLGGLADAVDLACDRARLRRDEVAVRPLPRPNVLERVRPPESSEHPAGAAGVGGTPPLLGTLLATLGLPAHGALTMPATWRLT